MANYNTVPQGQIGTGAAQVFGPNRALQSWIGQSQQQQQNLQNQQLKYQDTLKANDQQFNKLLMDISSSPLPNAYKADVHNLTNDLVKRGAELRAKGINPWSSSGNPEQQKLAMDFMKDANEIKAATTAANEFVKQKQALLSEYAKDPSSYDQDDFKKIYEFEKNVSLQDLKDGNVNIPTLNKVFNIQEAASKLKAPLISGENIVKDPTTGFDYKEEFKRADPEKTEKLVDAFYSPGSKALSEIDRQLKKQFGSYASVNGLYGTTDEDELREKLRAELTSNTDFNPVVELMSKGKIPSIDSPEFDRFLEDSVKEQLKAEKVLADSKSDTYQRLINAADSSSSRKLQTEEETLLRQRRAEQRAIESHNMSMTKGRLDIAKSYKSLNDKGEDSDITTGGWGSIKFGDSEDNKQIVVQTKKSFDSGDFMFTPSGQVSFIGTSNNPGKVVNKNKLPVQMKVRSSLIGNFPIDKDGNLVPVVNNAIGKNSGNYRWKTGVLVQDSDGQSMVIDPKDVSVALAGEKKKQFNAAWDRSKKELPKKTETKQAPPVKASATNTAASSPKKLVKVENNLVKAKSR